MKRYLTLAFLFIALAGCENTSHVATDPPDVEGDDLTAKVALFADVMRSIDEDISEFLSDPALTAVTKEFGVAVIPARALPFQSAVAIAANIPWSSWWYPKKDQTLYEDSAEVASPLTKYDRLRNSRKPGAASAAGTEKNAYNPRSVAWEGLCDAWALASISKPEPKRPVKMRLADSKKFVTFSVADLKALLLKTYEAVDDTDLKYYGQKFTGDYRGWIYPDIFPDQFHRFIEVQLFEKKLPFVMDHDAGVEVWNVPVYKANFTMAAVAGNPNAIFVRMWLYSAESVLTTEKSFVGTKETTREYDYVLLGTRNAAGGLVVKSGYWIKGPSVDSRKDHPDFITTIASPQRLVRKSWNPEIDVELVDEILAKSY